LLKSSTSKQALPKQSKDSQKTTNKNTSESSLFCTRPTPERILAKRAIDVLLFLSLWWPLFWSLPFSFF